MVSNIPLLPVWWQSRSSQITDADVPASSLAACIGEVDGVSEQHSVIIHLGHNLVSKHILPSLQERDS